MSKNTILLFISILLIFMSCVRAQEEYPVFGSEVLEDISVVEEHDEALVIWAAKGIKNAVLVHVDPYGSLKVVPDDNIEEIRKLVKDENRAQLQESRGILFDNTNYVHAAVRLGIISRVYWILPYSFFEDFLVTQSKVEDLLINERGFEESELEGLRMEAGCLTGNLSGVNIYFCSSRTLPIINDPVILSIDVSYFPVYAENYSTSKLRALKWFFDQLSFKQKVRVLHADVSYGVESGQTDPVHRYIGDELVQGLSAPLTFTAESPPELWQFRDKAENMLSGGEDELVVEYLGEPLNKYPDDPALMLLNAAAEIRLGKFDNALKAMDDICQKNEKYCYGYIYLGEIIDNKESAWKETFFKRASDALPDSKYVNKKVSHLIRTD